MGSAGAGSSIGLLLGAGERFDTLRDECGGPCPPARAPEIDEGERLEIAGHVLYSVAVALALSATIVLVAMEDDVELRASAGGLSLSLRM